MAWTCGWIEVYQDLQIFAAHLHFRLSAELISSGLVKKINWMASEQLNYTVIKGWVITRLIQSRPSHLALIPLESAEPGLSSPALYIPAPSSVTVLIHNSAFFGWLVGWSVDWFRRTDWLTDWQLTDTYRGVI